MTEKRIKNSVGIWSFGLNVTRFVPDGYHLEVKDENMTDRTKRIIDGLGELVDGYEYHYPNELNEENVDKIKTVLGDKDIYCIALGFHCMNEFIYGSFVNPDKKVREFAIDTTKKAVDLAQKIGAHLIIWPGGEGYNYPFQVSYVDLWNQFIDGIAEVVEYAVSKGVTVLLEHKHGEPAMKILMRNIGMTLFLINEIKERGVDISKTKINMDWQHLIMNGEHLPEYAALLMSRNLLGHNHANSGWGVFDDDNMVGGSLFIETLGIAKELQRWNYGSNGERIGYDLFPYTEDTIQAVKRSVLQWEFIYDIASKIDDEALKEAEKQKDAVKAYEIVYEAIGLDEDFIKKVYESRKEI